MPRAINERAIVFLIGAVQFVNILDFMMVMPLGPDFAKALGIPTSQLGYIGGSYTLAAAVSGVAGAFFLDNFDRRKALAVAMLGLVVGTFAGGLATGMPSLMAARVLAGLFGGPATSLSFSVIADVIPPERRGKAMGAVMGAFSVSSVFGVPLGLMLATWGGWRMPFFVVGAMGLVVALGAIALLPPLTGHLTARQGQPGVGALEVLIRPEVQLSYLMTFVVMAGGFILIPNLSAYLQQNLLVPREDIPKLYAMGGSVSFFSMRGVGYLVDRFGATATGTVASVALLGVLYIYLLNYQPWLPIPVGFVLMMLCLSSRNVTYNTLTSKVPSPRERARFMSFQSGVQHAASSAGAFLSARLLSDGADGKLVGIPSIVGISMALTAALPFLLHLVESRVKTHPQAVVQPIPPAAPEQDPPATSVAPRPGPSSP